MRRERDPYIVTGAINADGSVRWTSDPTLFDVFKVSTGIYDVVFHRNVRWMTAVGTTGSTSYATTIIPYNAGINGFRVGCNNTSNAAAADVNWNFVATVVPA